MNVNWTNIVNFLYKNTNVNDSVSLVRLAKEQYPKKMEKDALMQMYMDMMQSQGKSVEVEITLRQE